MSLLRARALTLTRIRHGKMDCVAEPRSGCATTVDACADAFVTGIEGRARRIYCPSWVRAMRWLKPVLSTRIGEFPILRHTAELMPRMDAEVAALGRSTSSYNASLEKP